MDLQTHGRTNLGTEMRQNSKICITAWILLGYCNHWITKAFQFITLLCEQVKKRRKYDLWSIQPNFKLEYSHTIHHSNYRGRNNNLHTAMHRSVDTFAQNKVGAGLIRGSQLGAKFVLSICLPRSKECLGIWKLKKNNQKTCTYEKTKTNELGVLRLWMCKSIFLTQKKVHKWIT